MLAASLVVFLLLVVPLGAQMSAALRCQRCHPEQVRTYAATGMGRSAGRPAGLPSGEFRHALSGSRFRVHAKRDGMQHEAERHGRRVSHEIEWFIGSGNEGRSFLIRLGDSLFQSPAAWYRRRSSYDMAPGYEQDRAPDFYRPVTPDCLFCHTGSVKAVPHTQNRYRVPALVEAAIHCDRCHGDPARHLAAPNRDNIVNPTRLAGPARDSVCEQCHLGGEARIPNRGSHFLEYRPGMVLEDVFTVYVNAGDKHTQRFRVVSHVQQLALSRCASASGGKLWCGSCHRIHTDRLSRPAQYRQACLDCHQAVLPAGEEHQTGDCVACHMPRKAAWDGGHTAFTDHRITRLSPGNTQPAAPLPDEPPLRAWREPAQAWRTRNLGLAYISTGERDASAWQLNEGFRLLTQTRTTGDPDPAVDAALGLILLHKERPLESLRFFQRALAANKSDSRAQLNFAAAAYAAGRSSEAVAALEQALAFEPLLEEAHQLLIEVHGRSGGHRQREAAWHRYRRLFPKRLSP